MILSLIKISKINLLKNFKIQLFFFGVFIFVASLFPVFENFCLTGKKINNVNLVDLQNKFILNPLQKSELNINFPTELIGKESLIPNLLSVTDFPNNSIYFYGLTVIIVFGLLFFIFIIKYQKKQLFIRLKQQNKKITEFEERLTTEKEKTVKTISICEKLKHDLERLQYAVDKVDNAVVIMDKTGNFEFVNQAFTRLYEMSFEEFKNKKTDIFAAAPNQRISESLKMCINRKIPVTYEFTDETKSGRRVWVQTTVTPMLDNKGDIERLIAIDSEITARKITENEIKQQNEEISAQRDELEKKNKELAKFADNINSSLRYALKIQQATLPSIENIKKKLNAFVFFRPKEIVSGDFYWFSEIPETKICFVAVTDCTGHGVPGAFMSLIGNRLLSETINEKRIFKPSEILENVNREIRLILNQQMNQNQDGMDISLIKTEKTTDNRTKVTFAGAKQSIFYYRNNHKIVQKLRGDIKTIGGKHYDESFFSDKELIFEAGDSLYLITDGIIDQNSSDKKKIGSPGFVKIIEHIADMTVEQQEKTLISIFDAHRKNEIQRDDITVIGIKFV
jgi:PAS domain S-box-containing protein